MEVPSVSMRLCVGDRAVPTEQKQALDDEGNIVDLDFVLLTSRAANLTWLEEALGRYARSFKFEAERLAADLWENLKWKQVRLYRRMMGTKPLGKSSLITVTVRGTSIRIWLPRKETLWLEATSENLEWLLRELVADAKEKALDNHGAQAEPLDDVNANLDCQELLDSDGQNAQAVPLDDVVVPLGDDAGAHEGNPTPLDVDAPLAENQTEPLAVIPTPNRKRGPQGMSLPRPLDLEERASDAENVEEEPRGPSASTETLEDDETSLRKQCLLELQAAMPHSGRVIWQPSRASFQIHFGLEKKEFTVRGLAKRRKRNCFGEAYLDAKRAALDFMATR